MDKMLTGKVAVITGSGQGIGKTCAETFLNNGAKVCLSDVVVDRLQATYEEFKLQYGAENVHQIPCDVTDKTQVEDLFKGTVDTFGAIDIVFNNAGVGIYEDWESVIQINQIGVIRCTYLALEYMKKSSKGPGGIIINMASFAGLCSSPLDPIYASSKFGVVGFTLSHALHADVVDSGVRMAVLCPTFVDTTMIDDDNMKYFIEKIGVIKKEKLADVVLEMVKDETNNGKCMVVTAQFHYYKDDFPKVEDVFLSTKQS